MPSSSSVPDSGGHGERVGGRESGLDDGRALCRRLLLQLLVNPVLLVLVDNRLQQGRLRLGTALEVQRFTKWCAPGCVKVDPGVSGIAWVLLN